MPAPRPRTKGRSRGTEEHPEVPSLALPRTQPQSSEVFDGDEEEALLSERPGGRDYSQDDRVNFEPSLLGPPNWVRQWSELSVLCSLPSEATSSASDAVDMALANDLREAVYLRQLIEMRKDGGLFSRSAIECEVPPEELDSSVCWWQYPQAAQSRFDELCATLREKLAEHRKKERVGFDDLGGVDGTATYTLPEGAQQIRKATLERFLLGDLFRPSSFANDDGATSHQFLHEGNRMPVVHSDFLSSGDGNRIDVSVLKDPSSDFASGQNRDQHAGEEFQRVITLNINFLRFRDHRGFALEHYYVSLLLDAFERYELLNSNLSPTGLRSRKYYAEQLHSVEASEGLTGAAGLASELNRLRGLLAEASDIEIGCVLDMAKAWRDIQASRESAQGTACPIVLHFRKHGDTEYIDFQDGMDPLSVVPVLTNVDMPQTPPPLNDKAQNQLPETFRLRALVRTNANLPPAEVGRTDPRPLDCTFSCRFNETFELHTHSDPVEMQLQILDGKGRVVSTVYVPQSLSEFAAVLPFETEETFEIEGQKREVCGVISLSTNWTTASGMTVDSIQHLFISGEADPMDPRHAHLISVLRKYYGEIDQGPQQSRAATKRQLDRIGDDRFLAPKVEISDLRLQVLQKRWQLATGEKLPEDDADTELIDLPIPTDALGTKRVLRKLKSSEGVDTQRSQKVLQEWQAKIRKLKITRGKKQMDDHDILAKHVTLPPVPTIKRFVNMVVSLFSPPSKLNPSREERQEAEDIDRAKLSEEKGNSQIVVHCMKASNLPLRDDGTPIEPFVEARFIDESATTRTEVGSYPSWFETLFLDFAPLDFDEETLSLIDDDVVVSIYDQVRIQLPHTHTTNATDTHITHYRTERRLIGTVKIPFYTLYQSSSASVEGLFTIHVGRWVMGYQFGSEEAETPSINLYVSLWPPLRKKEDPPQSIQETMMVLSALPVSKELHVLHQAAMNWKLKADSMIRSVASTNPLAGRREIEPFVTNSKGDPTLICRYILPKGCPPPAGLRTVTEVTHFVSLIPFVVDIMAWNDAKDVWSTNAEYMMMGAGDYEEMALLLVHYIRYVEPNSHCYLVLGEGDVYKQATFVLYGKPMNADAQSSDFYAAMTGGVDWKLIDPRIGCMYSIDNPRCGLTEVGVIVSHDQVWANVQLSGSPYRMVWALKDTRYWLPMFEKEYEAYLPHLAGHAVQSYVSSYPPCDDRVCREKEDLLKRKIKRMLKQWRNGRSPIFQERIGSVLWELLQEMETEKLKHAANKRDRYVDEYHHKLISEFSGIYQPIGVPINAPYRDENFPGLMNLIYETAVHEVGTDDVRFGLAVYIKGYTENIMSVWVYLVALLPRDSRH